MKMNLLWTRPKSVSKTNILQHSTPTTQLSIEIVQSGSLRPNCIIGSHRVTHVGNDQKTEEGGFQEGILQRILQSFRLTGCAPVD